MPHCGEAKTTVVTEKEAAQLQHTLGVLPKIPFKSINSCTTSKKLPVWLKIVGIIHFLTLKPIKGKLGFILKIIKKKNLKVS